VTFLSVVVPVYNEGDRLEEGLRHISHYLERTFPDHEIIVVDDGSTDSSAEVMDRVAAHLPRLRTVHYLPNQGKGMAVQRGMQRAVGDWIAIVDADLELPIEMLEGFFRVQRDSGAHVITGSKRHPESRVEYPRVRWFLSRAYGRLIRFLFDLPVSDTQVGFKLLYRPAVQAIFPHLFVKRFAFDVELLVLLNEAGARFAEAPVELHFGREGGGRIRVSTVLNMARETAGIWYRLYISQAYDELSSGPGFDRDGSALYPEWARA
jgi:glycosyltransferase involved in cell wall biosynthesis